jgi:hypothetical protein
VEGKESIPIEANAVPFQNVETNFKRTIFASSNPHSERRRQASSRRKCAVLFFYEIASLFTEAGENT